MLKGLYLFLYWPPGPIDMLVLMASMKFFYNVFLTIFFSFSKLINMFVNLDGHL